MKTADVCKRDVAVVRRDTPLVETARVMRERHGGCVVVVDELRPGRPIGIVTDRDVVVEVVAAGMDPRTMCAGEIMSAPLVTAREDDDALEALRAMRFRGVRRVPVVDAEGFLAGIATLDDLLELAGEALNDVVGAITSERSLEGMRRR